jgi:hypothetical protein
MKSSSTENSKRYSSFKNYKKDILDLNYDSDYSIKNNKQTKSRLTNVTKTRSRSSGSVSSSSNSRTYSRSPSASTRTNSPKKSRSNLNTDKNKLSNTYTKSNINNKSRHQSYSSRSRSTSSRSKSRSLSPPDSDYKKPLTNKPTAVNKAKSMDNDYGKKYADSQTSKRSDIYPGLLLKGKIVF